MSFIAAAAVGSGIAAAGSIGGALIGSSASKSAAQTQAEAADRATQLQREEWETAQQNEAPWLAAGKTALSRLSGLSAPGSDFMKGYPAFSFGNADFMQDPGYQFRISEGQKAIERGAAARGGVSGGAALKAMNQYTQNFASNEYSNAYNRAIQNYTTNFNVDQANRANTWNRLSQLSGSGLTAASGLNQAGQQYATNAGNLMTQGANAQAAGTIGVANAWNAGISNLSDLAAKAYYGRSSSYNTPNVPEVPEDLQSSVIDTLMYSVPG